MAKLYPPYIEGSLPAAYLDDEGWHLKIPFSMNRAVSNAQVSKMKMRISTLSSKQIINEEFTFSPGVYELNRVVAKTDEINIGQYYKVQLAYVDNAGSIGYYSTVGIVKCIAKPTITIKNLNRNGSNFFNGTFTGRYELDEDNADLSERVYSCEFFIYDSQNKLYTSSGVIIHDNNSDVEINACEDSWIPDKFGNEEDSEYYLIQYKITTLNGYVGYSPKYKLQMFSMFAMDPPMFIYPLPDFDNGCVEIVLIGLPDETLIHEQKYTGSYVISRRVVSDYEDESWVQLHKFRLTKQEPSSYIFRDFTVEQGVIYKYSIQQINSFGMFTDRIISAPVYADFEDMFLFDGRRALRIRFNPKVASFKTTLQESKTDTIGSKYPYFFRNGNVAYKEFPIAGLLSYFIDDSELFIKDAALGLEEEQNPREESLYWRKYPLGIHEDNEPYENVNYGEDNITYRNMTFEEKARLRIPSDKKYIIPSWYERRKKDAQRRVRTRNFTGYNMFAERKFKLKVLDWLNDGKLKLFKSPAEGNYIVRLMNNSLSPEDQLGRMIHNFSSTAYEAADNSVKGLLDTGIVKLEDATPDPGYHWETVWMYPSYAPSKYYNKNDGYILIDKYAIISFEVHDFIPGDNIEIHRKGDEEDSWERIVIGPTGNYIVQKELKPIDKIRVELPSAANVEPVRHGWIDICFLEDTTTPFDMVKRIDIDASVGIQIPGDNTNVLEREDLSSKNSEINWEYLKISQRPRIQVYYNSDGGDYKWGAPSNSQDADDKSPIYWYKTFLDLVDDCGSTWGIYVIRKYNTPNTIWKYKIWDEESQSFQDVDKADISYDTRFAINEVPGKVDDKEQYVEYHHLGHIDRLWLGHGVLAEAIITKFSITYANEEE